MPDQYRSSLVLYVSPSFGIRLKARIKAIGESQAWFVDQIKGSRSTFEKVLLGNRRPPLGDELQRWADILQLTEGERFEFIEDAYLAHVPEWVEIRYRRMRGIIRWEVVEKGDPKPPPEGP